MGSSDALDGYSSRHSSILTVEDDASLPRSEKSCPLISKHLASSRLSAQEISDGEQESKNSKILHHSPLLGEYCNSFASLICWWRFFFTCPICRSYIYFVLIIVMLILFLPVRLNAIFGHILWGWIDLEISIIRKTADILNGLLSLKNLITHPRSFPNWSTRESGNFSLTNLNRIDFDFSFLYINR